MANAQSSRVTRIGEGTLQLVSTVVGRVCGLPSGLAGEFPNFVLTATEVVDGSTLIVTVDDSMDGTTFVLPVLVTFATQSGPGTLAVVNPLPLTRMPLPYVRVTAVVGAGAGSWTWTVDCDTRLNNP